MDITTIFANLLDNAIEAIGSEGQEPRFLKISVKEAKDFLIIHVAKSMGNVQKQEKKHEGLGLGNVKEAVEKYEGICTIEKIEKQFQVIIMISSNHFQEVEKNEKK